MTCKRSWSGASPRSKTLGARQRRGAPDVLRLRHQERAIPTGVGGAFHRGEERERDAGRAAQEAGIRSERQAIARVGKIRDEAREGVIVAAQRERLREAPARSVGEAAVLGREEEPVKDVRDPGRAMTKPRIADARAAIGSRRPAELDA